MIKALMVLILTMLACGQSVARAQPASNDEHLYLEFKTESADCGTAILLKKLENGAVEADVSAMAKGKGSASRNWEVYDIKLEADGLIVRPVLSRKFYTTLDSLFKYPAAVLFGALGVMNEQYVTDASGVSSVQGTKLQRGIDKAGMAFGLGLLVTQAKGEITGLKSVFKVDAATAAGLAGPTGFVRIVIRNNRDGRTEKARVAIRTVSGER